MKRIIAETLSGETTVQCEEEAKFLTQRAHCPIDQLGAFLKKSEAVVHEQRDLHQTDHYYDTERWDLFHAGWSFRLREVEAGGVAIELKSIKGGRGGAIYKRQEMTQPIGRVPNNPALLPSGAATDLLRSLTNGSLEQLSELFQIHTHRKQFRVAYDQSTLLLCVDETSVATGDRRKKAKRSTLLRFHEIELELVDGNARSLELLARELQGQLPLLPARQSKFERGLRAMGLNPKASRNPSLAVSPSSPALSLAHGRMSEQLDTLVREEKCAWEGLDPEGVHQMRVASRRLRVALRVFRSSLPTAATNAFLEEVKWITSSLGGVRDLDVYRSAVIDDANEAHCKADKFQDHLDVEWVKARRRLLKTLSSDRYRDFKKNFRKFLKRRFWSKDGKKHRRRTTRKAAKLLLEPALERFLEEGNRIREDSSEESLHALRIRGKRFRYLLEIFEPVFSNDLKDIIDAAKRIQDYLGNHHDASIALGRLNQYEDRFRSRSSKPKLGKLKKHVRQRRDKLTKNFPKQWKAFVAQAKVKNLRRSLAK